MKLQNWTKMHFFLQRTHALVRKVGKRRERRRGKDPKEVRLPCDRDAKPSSVSRIALGTPWRHLQERSYLSWLSESEQVCCWWKTIEAVIFQAEGQCEDIFDVLWAMSRENCGRWWWLGSQSGVRLWGPKPKTCIKPRLQIIFQWETENRFFFSERRITLITLWRWGPNQGGSNVRVRIHRQGCWGVQMRPPVLRKVRACHPDMRETLGATS